MRLYKEIIVLSILLVLFSCKEKQQITTEDTPVKFSEFNGKLASGTLKLIDSFPSKFVRPRTVAVWLPNGYCICTMGKCYLMQKQLGTNKNGK